MRASSPIKENNLPSILSLYPSSLLAFAFCISSLFLTYFTYQSLRHSQHEDEHRYQTYLLATQLHRRSDQLTLMARSYAMTGEEKFLGFYNKALNFRVGKQFQKQHHHHVYWDMLMPESSVKVITSKKRKSFKQLIEKLKLPENEMALLLQVKSISGELSKIELQALSEIENGLTSSAYVNSEGRKRALSLLYSKRYLIEKENIDRYINDFFDLQEPRSINAIESNTRKHYILATLTTLSFLALISFLLYILYRQSKSKRNYSAGVKIFGSVPFNNKVNAVEALIPCFLLLDR